MTNKIYPDIEQEIHDINDTTKNIRLSSFVRVLHKETDTWYEMLVVESYKGTSTGYDVLDLAIMYNRFVSSCVDVQHIEKIDPNNLLIDVETGRKVQRIAKTQLDEKTRIYVKHLMRTNQTHVII